MQNYIHLKWDSNFFGFNVASISKVNIDNVGLTSILQELKIKKYRLIYWIVPSGYREISKIVHKQGGFLVNEKVTYFKDITNTTFTQKPSLYFTVPYSDAEPNDELINLTLKSGTYSRFRLDPLFPDTLFDKLYTCWITRSVHKEIAHQVLVVNEENTLLGMITLGTKDRRGSIGLVAVSDHAKRKGIGRLLVQEGEKFFIKEGHSVVQVITQRINLTACRLYESCGYQVEKIENIFHFWI